MSKICFTLFKKKNNNNLINTIFWKKNIRRGIDDITGMTLFVCFAFIFTYEGVEGVHTSKLISGIPYGLT